MSKPIDMLLPNNLCFVFPEIIHASCLSQSKMNYPHVGSSGWSSDAAKMWGDLEDLSYVPHPFCDCINPRIFNTERTVNIKPCW